MTGAQGLSPEQLGALRSAELTEGAVNARNIFNQSEINRRNAVAEKNASDMLKANKGAQNMESAIKLGMMAKKYYPEIKEAVGGVYDYVTGASNAEQTLGGGMAESELPSAVGAGTSAYEGASAAYQGVSAATAAGLPTSVGSSLASEGGVLALSETGTMGAAAAGTTATAGTTLGSVVGGVATGVGYAAAGSAARTALGSIFANQSNNVLKTQGEYMLAEPTFEGLSNRVMTDVFAKGKAWIRDDVEPWLDPAGTILKKAGCIIVTACTDRLSYEVEVTRQYRDKFLTKEHLVGYYYLAEKIVPKIENNVFWKYLTKKILVDNLIQYGKYKLGISEKASLLSKIITTLFLNQCKKTGKRIKTFTRCNGEIY